MFELIKKNWVCLVFIASVLFLFMHFFLFNFSDYLGFDAIGYTLRYKLAFSGWNNSMMLGFPASFFDQPFPSLLPMLFDFIGVGNYTLPYIFSVLVLRIMLILSFLLLPFKNTKMKLLLGIFFALNPFTFNFFYRIYELAGWVFFVPAFGFIYTFLNEKKFNLNFFLAVFFSAACALSSSSPLFFLVLGSFLLLNFGSLKNLLEDLKSLLVFWITTGLIVSFWFIPYFYYLDYSYVKIQAGLELQTTGIAASGIFLALLMIYAFFKALGANSCGLREKTILLGSIVLGFLILTPPMLPVIDKPFAHAYHAFFIFVLSWVLLSAKNIQLFIPKIDSLPKKIVLVAVLVLVLFMLPKTTGQYMQNYPVIFDKEYISSDGTIVSFEEALQKMNSLPENSRYLEFPQSPNLESFIALNNPKISSVLGWGFNPYVRENAFWSAIEMEKMGLSCDEFLEKSNMLGITHFAALTKEAKNYLNSCGMKTADAAIPSIHSPPELKGIVENGKLIEFGNNKIVLEINPPFTILKMNYFPKWKIYPERKFEDLNPGIKIFTDMQETIELKYEKTFIEEIAGIFSIAGIALTGILLLFVKKI